MIERYSNIQVQQLNVNSLSSQGDGQLAPAAEAKDPNVPRFRLLYTTGEALDLLHCKQKAQWR